MLYLNRCNEMKYRIEASCVECPLTFCCANCRRKHESKVHGLEYECPLCRRQKFLCEPRMVSNSEFLAHVVREHLPLHCEKCDKYFTKMEDLVNIEKCVTISEIVNKGEQLDVETDGKEVDDKFQLLYVNSAEANEDNQNEAENFEAIVSVDKSSRTAVITPIMRQKYLVDYDTSGSSDTEDIVSYKSTRIEGTPHPKMASKSSKNKRAATPHIRKFLLRQRVVEEEEDEQVDHNGDTIDASPKNDAIKNGREALKPTPTHEDEYEQLSKQSNEITTPNSHLAGDRCAKIGSAVTTSTPTHPVTGAWTIFPEQGADSPLSEIEGTTGESPAQSIDNEPSKSENSESVLPKLKSIIVTNSKLRLESQDSSEKQPTFQDSGSADVSANKTKRVKFAEDTVFEQDRGPRIFRKPKRVLTPGPQKPRFCFNPRFQALINRFENQGKTMARSPSLVRFTSSDQGTPAVGDNAVRPVRAIDFKDDSAVAELDKSSATDKDSTGNEVFKSCIESPRECDNLVENNALNKVISALTNNIAGSLETCLSTALRSTEDHTEVQFKFVITKRKVSVKRIADYGSGVEERATEVDRIAESNKENIWSAVARAVKKVIWGDEKETNCLASNTPVDRLLDIYDSELAGKRKYGEMLDSQMSPVNHKRHKFEGRIRGRPPLPRSGRQVSKLKTSFSGDGNRLLKSGQRKNIP